MTGARLIASPHLLCVSLVVAMASASAQPPAAAPGADDLAISAGHWDVVAVEWNGKQVDREFLSMLKVAFKADGAWAVLFKNMPVAEGKSTNRQDQSPKKFEMETLGSDGIKPRRYAGIYRVDGDTRVLCIAAYEDPRPDEFSAPSRSGRMLVTLKRVKEP